MLQFQPYNPTQPSASEYAKEWGQGLNNIGQTLDRNALQSQQQRQMMMQQMIQQNQERRAQQTFQNEQQQFMPQGQQPGWNQPGEGDLTSQPSYGVNAGPTSQNPVSLFKSGGMGSQNAPESPPNAPTSTIDHWDATYPHLASGHARTDIQGFPDQLNNDINNPSLSPYQVNQRLSMFGKGQEFQKTQATINKENADARKALSEANGGGAKGLALSEKEDQFYQKEWDKIDKEANPLTTSGRTGLGMAARADYNANRALVTLNKPMVTNQEAANVMADIAQIYQGGSATQYGMSHQGYDSLYQKITGLQQYITGNPKDSLPDAIKSRLVGVLNEMRNTNKAVFKQQLDHIERAQPKVIGRFKNEWQGIRSNLENGIAGGPTQNPGGATHRWNPQTSQVEVIQ